MQKIKEICEFYKCFTLFYITSNSLIFINIFNCKNDIKKVRKPYKI